MGVLDVLLFGLISYVPAYFVLKVGFTRNRVLIAIVISFLLTLISSLALAVWMSTHLDLPTSIFDNRTQAELSYGVLGFALGFWEATVSAKGYKSGNRRRYPHTIAVGMLGTIPPTFGTNNITKGGDFLPGFVIGLITTLFIIGCCAVIRIAFSFVKRKIWSA